MVVLLPESVLVGLLELGPVRFDTALIQALTDMQVARLQHDTAIEVARIPATAAIEAARLAQGGHVPLSTT